jgi:hypothetical protein
MTPNAPTEANLSNADILMSVQGISKAFGDQQVSAIGSCSSVPAAWSLPALPRI